MKINVKVTPRAAKNSVEFIEAENYIRVRTTAPPFDGKANEAVIKLISEYFGVSKSNIQITTGLATKHKIVEIEGVSREDLIKKPRLF